MTRQSVDCYSNRLPKLLIFVLLLYQLHIPAWELYTVFPLLTLGRPSLTVHQR